ncbi:MAG: hypothetical protein JRN53_06870, partial [Nitrososphaerota archaeon]|nr:hypothetical protein [Nitrososphaerota archaeon]
MTNSILRKRIDFEYIRPLYAKPKITLSDGLDELDSEFKLYEAHILREQPPIIIYDVDGYVKPQKLEYSLVPLDSGEITNLKQQLPKKIEKLVEDMIADYGAGSFAVYFKPVSTLKNPELLKALDWQKDVLNQIVNHGDAITDPNVILVRKCTLLKGIKMSANPHFIEVLPPNTGKTEFAAAVGIHEDKASAPSLIGTADLDGPRPGSLNGTEVPVSFDQIEETGTRRLLRYLLSFMELGWARVDNATYPFKISGSSTIGIYANPLGDPKNDFAFLLMKLSENPALGRRFGLFLYDYDRDNHRVPRIAKKAKDLIASMGEALEVFRATEDFAKKKLKAILDNDQVWTWLNEKNDVWIEQALNVIEPLRSKVSGEGINNLKLYEFFANFIRDGTTHTRGAALYGAIAENLPRIALGEFDADPTPSINRAEELLADILEMNYQSLLNIVTNVSESQVEIALRIYSDAPKYIQAIINACELLKPVLAKESKLPVTISLKSIKWHNEKFKYWGQVVDAFRDGNPEKSNDKLRAFFGIELSKERYEVTFFTFDKSLPTEPDGVLESTDLKDYFGNFGNFGNFGMFSGEGGSGQMPQDQHKNDLVPA